MNEIKLTTSLAFSITGLIGNTLVIYILSRPKFKKESLFRYLLIASINDTIFLSYIWSLSYISEFKLNSIEILCKLFFYTSRIFFSLSPWIIVISSIDRFIATKYPTHYLFRKKFKYQALVILIVFISITLINIPYYYFIKIININTNLTSCQFEDLNTLFFIDLLGFLSGTIIPFFMMVLFNSMTFKELLKSKKTIQRKKFDKEYRFFKILIFMNLFFLICYLPIYIYTVTYDILGIQYVGTSGFVYLNYLTFFYSSLNFFVYFSSNKLFRKYVLSIICFCRIK